MIGIDAVDMTDSFDRWPPFPPSGIRSASTALPDASYVMEGELFALGQVRFGVVPMDSSVIGRTDLGQGSAQQGFERKNKTHRIDSLESV